MRRMSADVQKLVDEWRTRKVNALLAMVGSLLQRSGKTPSLVQDGVLQKVRWWHRSQRLRPGCLVVSLTLKGASG